MVYGQVARIAAEGARAAGIYLIPRAIKAFSKYDRAVFRGLYGKSAGRGVRHGRDIGAAVGGLMATQRGDDLDGARIQPGNQASSKFKTYRGRGKFNRSRRANYCPGDRKFSRSKSKFSYSR